MRRLRFGYVRLVRSTPGPGHGCNRGPGGPGVFRTGSPEGPVGCESGWVRAGSDLTRQFDVLSCPAGRRSPTANRSSTTKKGPPLPKERRAFVGSGSQGGLFRPARSRQPSGISGAPARSRCRRRPLHHSRPGRCQRAQPTIQTERPPEHREERQRVAMRLALASWARNRFAAGDDLDGRGGQPALHPAPVKARAHCRPIQQTAAVRPAIVSANIAAPPTATPHQKSALMGSSRVSRPAARVLVRTRPAANPAPGKERQAGRG